MTEPETPWSLTIYNENCWQMPFPHWTYRYGDFDFRQEKEKNLRLLYIEHFCRNRIVMFFSFKSGIISSFALNIVLVSNKTMH